MFDIPALSVIVVVNSCEAVDVEVVGSLGVVAGLNVRELDFSVCVRDVGNIEVRSPAGNSELRVVSRLPSATVKTFPVLLMIRAGK